MSDLTMGGLTIEEVIAMQDEMNRIDDDDVIEDKTDVDTNEGDNKVAEEPGDGDTSGKEATSTDDSKKADDEGKKDEGDPRDEELRNLREMLRKSEDALSKSAKDYAKLNKILIDKGLITEEEVQADKEEKEKQDAIFQARQDKLTEILALMEINPVYADVQDVCSQSNFDDVIVMFAKYYVKENGGSISEVVRQMETEIWAEVNPYKKMYELIKTYHPKYAKKEDDKGSKSDGTVKEKKPVEANPSAASMGPGGAGKGGAEWSAAKIEAIPEDELHTKVPKDIYERYMRGEIS